MGNKENKNVPIKLEEEYLIEVSEKTITNITIINIKNFINWYSFSSFDFKINRLVIKAINGMYIGV